MVVALQNREYKGLKKKRMKNITKLYMVLGVLGLTILLLGITVGFLIGSHMGKKEAKKNAPAEETGQDASEVTEDEAAGDSGNIPENVVDDPEDNVTRV